MMTKSILFVVILCSGLLGCGQAPERKHSPETPLPSSSRTSPPSTAQTVVDGITGKAAIEQGIQAREKIKAISAKEQRDLDEALRQ